MAGEAIDLVGGPMDGRQLVTAAGETGALVWFRSGDAIEFDGRGQRREVRITLPYPTRHRYLRTDRKTAAGATVFRHAGRLVGIFE